jgi:hypothetical protein
MKINPYAFQSAFKGLVFKGREKMIQSSREKKNTHGSMCEILGWFRRRKKEKK